MTTTRTQSPSGKGRAVKIGGAVLAAGMAVSMIAWTATATAALPPQGYADLVEKVSPAVVFISSVHKAHGQHGMNRGSEQMPFRSPFPPGSPFGEFFKRFGQQMPEMQAPRPRGPMTALGSGFIIDPQGDIVTNNHVIDGADTVKVKLQDGREFEAQVVGTDPQTDLALVKVKADGPLPYVSFGDSAKLRVGDVVVAVGNPFGLGGTVTAGIVSARNRDINAGPYDDFIQTDAPINRGNSGGPLFNAEGKVVGVNTAIYSPNGGSIGIGFAIPSNLVKNVVVQIKDHGVVERGWLGVKIQAVTPDIAKAMGSEKLKGALVAEVVSDSPAKAAGIKQGDVIVRYDGKAVKTMHTLPNLVADTRAGQTVAVELFRNGKKQSVSVKIGELKPEMMASLQDGHANPGKAESKTLGAELATLDDDARAQLNLPADAKGVVIASVDPAGRAAAVGLRPGDVIEKIGSSQVDSPAQVRAALTKVKSNAVLLLINRGGNELFVALKLADA